MFKNKLNEFLKLYEKTIKSIDYHKIIKNLNNYSKNRILKLNKEINKKIENIKEYFTKNQNKLSTVENLEKTILYIEERYLFFENDYFYELLEDYIIKINYKKIKNQLEKFNKNQISKIFFELINIIKLDFQNSILQEFNYKNQIKEISQIRNKNKKIKNQIILEREREFQKEYKEKIIKTFLNLYIEIFKSINYQKLKKTIKKYKKIDIISIYNNINKKTNILIKYFIENKKELLIKESLKKIIFEINKNNYCFNIDNFNKDLKKLSKYQIIDFFITTIENLRKDFVKNILIK